MLDGDWSSDVCSSDLEAQVQGAPERLRPGMEGIGKVVVGERSLLWIWTHGFVDWLRLTLWNFTP
jgi:hypothetical protein